MSATTNINLKLEFNQVLDLVKQLSKKQQHELVSILEKENKNAKNLTSKEDAFLTELDEAIDFVNNYPKEKKPATTFKQMIDAL